MSQPSRRGEIWATKVSEVLGFLIPANYKPIAAEAVANALLTEVPAARGKRVLLSGAMQP